MTDQHLRIAHSRSCAPESELRPLTIPDIAGLYLDSHSRIDAQEAEAIVRRNPGASFWMPSTGEFILVSTWRHRQELDTVHTFGAFGNEDILLDAVMEHAREAGRAGFVIVDVNETRQPQFYERHGLRQLEHIVTYENRHPFRLASAQGPPGLDFQRVLDAGSPLLGPVHDLDHAAFPWFWWNSLEEFVEYLDYPGVEVWAGLRDGDVVSYTGLTQYRRWAHLDRIATRPGLQGLGIGRAALAFVARTIVERGGRRLALSTQGNNDRSRGLYQRSGFVRTPGDDYSIFVVPFDEARIYSGMSR